MRDIPLLPQEVGERVTPDDRVFTLAHFGLGRIAPADWFLSIEGRIAKPLRLTLDALAQFPRVSIEAVHQCAGNPLQPEVPTRRVFAVVWGGVRLAEVLEAVKPAPGGKFLWADRPIDSVEVSDDRGDRWDQVGVEPRRDRTWQRWRHLWRPRASGPVRLCCRACDDAGALQPEAGRHNAWHRVELAVASL